MEGFSAGGILKLSQILILPFGEKGDKRVHSLLKSGDHVQSILENGSDRVRAHFKRNNLFFKRILRKK